MLSDQAKQCFVMMPFGTKQGINFDTIFEDLIRPVVESPGSWSSSRPRGYGSYFGAYTSIHDFQDH